MSELTDQEVVTRHGETKHEDIGSQLGRLDLELWNKVDEAVRISEEFPSQAICHSLVYDPDEVDVEIDQTFQNDWGDFREGSGLRQTFRTNNRHHIYHHHVYRALNDYLHTLQNVLFDISTQATTETSTVVSFLQTMKVWIQRLEGPQLAHQIEWTDEKNQRRCELVDMEIDGTLSSAERIELEELQAEMLAYRRKVAPLPLDDLRKIHQELLREVSDQTD